MRSGNVTANTLAQILGKVIGASSTVIISFLLAHTLGSSGYGKFSIIYTYVAAFYAFVDFGLNATYVKKRSLPDQFSISVLLITRSYISILLIAFALIILICMPAKGFGGYTTDVKFGIGLLLPTIFLQGLITSFNAEFQHRMKYSNSTISIAVGSVVTVCCVFVTHVLFHEINLLTSALIGIMAGSLVTALTGFLLIQDIRLYMPKLSEMRSLFVRSLPLGVTLVFNVLYFRADSYILAVFRPLAEVGAYGLAYKFFEIPLVLPTFVMNSLFPLIILACQKNDYTWMHVNIKKYSVILFVSGIAVSSMYWLCAPLVVYIKSDFSASILPLKILSLGFPVYFLTAGTLWILVSAGKNRELMNIYIGSMLLNTAANYLLIPVYGYLAAAWITVISEIGILLFSCLVVWKNFIKLRKFS